MKNLIKKVIALSIVMCSTYTVMAHSYWLEVKGSGKVNDTVTVSLFFGEFENKLKENKSYFLKNMETFTVWNKDENGVKIDLKLQKDTNCFKAFFVPNSKGIYTVFFKEDSRAVQDWTKHGLGIIRPFENLKALYKVGKTKNNNLTSFIESKIDIMPYKSEYQLLLNNTPFANKEISITTDKAVVFKIKTDNNGIFVLPKAKGMLLIDVDYKDNQKGVFDGKEFESSRYKYALTLNL